MKMNLVRVLEILFMSCVVHSEESIEPTILNDIRSAFRMVSNNTHVLDAVISKMYDVPASIKSSLLFKIPNPINGYTMVTMQRGDFTAPVFPNITTDDMAAAKKKRHPSKKQTQKAVQSSLLNANNIWTILGLNGWTGDISQPIESLEQNHGDSATIMSEVSYPTDEIIKSFERAEVAPTNKDERMETAVGSYKTFLNQTASEVTNMDAHIFIARVNDPFGRSTKWELRNHSSNTEDRSKRDVVTLYSMIKCSTGCDPLMYKGFGCYCGFLGEGIPVNGIDRCCKLHDKCYEQSNCISYLEYFVPYVWTCRYRKPICAIDHGEWGGPKSCAARLCYCDLRLSRCLRKFTCPKRRAICTSSTARRFQNLLFF